MIARLLVESRAAEETVAFGREGARDFGALRADVAALAARLGPAAGRRVLLHCEDAYAFAVGLLAAGQVGARAVLPPSRQPGALRQLAGEVDCLLLDGADAPEAVEGTPCLHPLERGRTAQGDPPPAVALDRDASWIELFTSGTTGAGKRVVKAVRHLEDEVRMLEAELGSLLGAGTRVLATMAPQHLYGLLFRVLWPLAAGRPFLRSLLLHPVEFAPHFTEGEAEGSAPRPFALASTPVALRHLVERDELGRGAASCRAVFSSGGPLDPALARRAAAVFGAPPVEIYGSTETGGVARRRQHRGGEAWRPLPGVDVEADPASGCLVATSAFVSQGEPRPGGRGRFVLGDRVTFEPEPDAGFHLRGRADRVVKIGEKRLALPEMETRLRAHPAVADAALAVLEASGDARVGAVVVPSEEGREILAAGGRRALSKALGEHLAADFDRVLLPRAWRVAEALPRDAQGKTPAEALRSLLAEAGAPTRQPEVQRVARGEGHLEATLRIPEDLAFLEGHFPGQPVVAGVVQVHFAMRALEELLGAPPQLARLEALKFHEILRPGDAVLLRVALEAEGPRFTLSLVDPAEPARVFASARGALRGDGRETS